MFRASSRLFWAGLLCLPRFSFLRCSITPSCTMKPPTSNSSRRRLHSFQVTLLFHALQLSISSHSWQGPSLFENQDAFYFLACPIPPSCIDSSIVVLVFAARNPNTFLHQIEVSSCRSTLLTMSCPPKCDSLHLPSLCLESSRNHFGLSHFNCVFLRCCCFCRISYNDMCLRPHTPLRSMLLCFTLLLHKNTFLWALAQALRNPSILPPNSER